MKHQKELSVFDDCVRSRALKSSGQRREILKTFLETERHVSADDLLQLVKRKNPTIGVATVYRTIKLICECGLGRELRLTDGSVRYEHLYGHEHHDHLYCINCGELIEVVDAEIEKLQEKLAKKVHFKMFGHRLLIHGLCRNCR